MMSTDKPKPCLGCKKLDEQVKKYPAFHWSGGGSYRLKDLFIWLHPACYRPWYNSLIAGLAELDQVMDYCEYFQREKGQLGFYVREGKSFPVHGSWDEYHLNCNHGEDRGFVCCKMKPFTLFLKENGWLEDWFKLKGKYAELTVQNA